MKVGFMNYFIDMKKIALMLISLVGFFGTFPMYAASAKDTARGVTMLFHTAQRNHWPKWVIVLILIVGIVAWIDAMKKEKDKGKKSSQDSTSQSTRR